MSVKIESKTEGSNGGKVVAPVDLVEVLKGVAPVDLMFALPDVTGAFYGEHVETDAPVDVDIMGATGKTVLVFVIDAPVEVDQETGFYFWGNPT